MPLFSLEGKRPHIHPDAFVAPTATLVGEVVVEAGASVWYNAVLRADYSPIIVREGANVQDGSVLHGPPDQPTVIGTRATVAHLCVVHGATIEPEALIGNGCTILDGARVGARCLVAAHSLVSAGADLPAGMFVAGVPAVVKRPVSGSVMEMWINGNPGAYAELARRHGAGLEAVQ